MKRNEGLGHLISWLIYIVNGEHSLRKVNSKEGKHSTGVVNLSGNTKNSHTNKSVALDMENTIVLESRMYRQMPIKQLGNKTIGRGQTQ